MKPFHILTFTIFLTIFGLAHAAPPMTIEVKNQVLAGNKLIKHLWDESDRFFDTGSSQEHGDPTAWVNFLKTRGEGIVKDFYA